MTDATKKQALAKLHAIANKIGYPDRWRDYSALRIERGDAVGNSHRANTFEFHRQLDKIGKPVDKTEWEMTPPTVNAYYNPLENNINFPAGILQPPFYGANGRCGGQLRRRRRRHRPRADARLRRPGAAVRRRRQPERLVDGGRRQGLRRTHRAASSNQYGGFTAVDDVKLNGKLTLGENTADNGGAAARADGLPRRTRRREPPTLDGFTPEQRVFLGWGRSGARTAGPKSSALRAQTNPHSPGRYRVNGVVSNMPEFQKAFSCKADAPMVRRAGVPRLVNRVPIEAQPGSAG